MYHQNCGDTEGQPNPGMRRPGQAQEELSQKICLAILFISPVRNLFGNVDVTYLKSALFATFMMAITFNGFNARTSHINVFESLGRNKNFLLVIGAIFLMQFVFVTFGGDVLSVESLSVQSWIVCIVLAFLVIPIDMIRKVIMRKN